MHFGDRDIRSGEDGVGAEVVATNTLDDEIKDGGVTSAKLADNAITSRTYTRTAISADDDSFPKEVTAACDAGDTVTGGGYVANFHGKNVTVSPERNYAVDSRTWLARVNGLDALFVCPCPWQLTVIANCMG